MIKINPKVNTSIIIKYMQFYNNNYYNRKTFFKYYFRYIYL